MPVPTERRLDEQTCNMVCPISAGMVGVCLTAVSLIRVVITTSHQQTLADDLISLDAVGFLVATLTSYFALRTPDKRRVHRLERIADAAFIASMVLLAADCLFITYAISST